MILYDVYRLSMQFWNVFGVYSGIKLFKFKNTDKWTFRALPNFNGYDRNQYGGKFVLCIERVPKGDF